VLPKKEEREIPKFEGLAVINNSYLPQLPAGLKLVQHEKTG